MSSDKKKNKKDKKKLPALNFRKLIRIYRLFTRHYREQWKLLTLGYSAMLGVIILGLLTPVPLKLIIDYVILPNSLPTQTFWTTPLAGMSREMLLVVFASSFFLLHFLDMFMSYMNKVGLLIAGSRMIARFRETLFAHLQRLSLSFHKTSASGDLVYRMTTDVNEINALLVDVPQQTLKRLVSIFLYIGVMLYVSWELALIAFAIIPLIFLVNGRFSKGVKKATKKKKKKESEVSSLITDNITAMALVQAYGREGSQLALFAEKNQKSKGYQIEAIKLSKIFKRMNAVLISLGTALVIYYGGVKVLDGTLLPGTIVLFSYYLKKLYGPLDKFSALIFDIAKAQVAGERLLELMECDMIIEDSPDAVEAKPFSGRIAFHDVSFSYREGEPVLKGLSFSVEPGERIAIVGQSGSGKSTLVSLLMRFYDPQQGEVRFDDVDIRGVTLHSLRDQITILMQDASLLNETVHENIAFGRDGAAETDVIQAAVKANANTFIMEMPKGYNTVIAEGGDNLSGGQKQRINIARALVRSTPVLIFDEPATALDARSESEVTKGLEEATRGRTTFMIAHNFATLRNFDKILFLQPGGDAVFGTPDEVQANSAPFRELLAAQTGHVSSKKPEVSS